VASERLAVVVGSIGKLPYGGHSFFVLHYIVGLQELGYSVHYVERVNRPDECYDPRAGTMTGDPSYALTYLRSVLPRVDIDTRTHMSFVDLTNRCHGSTWEALRRSLDRAELLLTVGDPTWFDELERCPRRAFIDVDPVFTQAAMASGTGTRAETPRHYPVLFTYGGRIGQGDCPVPTAGRDWIGTVPVVATQLWNSPAARAGAPVTALLHWAAGSEVVLNGRRYGHKDREFERFLDLPQQTGTRIVAAIGGRRTPRQLLTEHGWELVDPLEVSGTIDAYRDFILGSRAELGISKHAYVASRCGWFSDRSACYLAAGRPVLHQDTGCGEILPTGEGLLLFKHTADVVWALEELDADYARHAQAARRIAEEHLEARLVVGRMLDEAGFR
jgi:hypothetical protein